MEPRNFKEDLDKTNTQEIREAWIELFKKKFGEDCEVIWKDSVSEQKGFGTDVVIKMNKGRRYSVELKTRNCNTYKDLNYIMEIISHTYDCENKEKRKHLFSKEGWIYTTTAEYLFHATINKENNKIIECIFYSLSPFKNDIYRSEFDKYDPLWLTTKYPNGNFQLTLNKLIPKEVIKKDAVEFWEMR